MEIKNRSEVLFLYDVRDANPNGDPDENKPRIDEETGVNIVTDVRLKRTIRDYLANFRKLNVWVKEEIGVEGMRKTREEKLDEVLQNIEDKEEAKKKLLSQFIDLRLFGATIAGKKEKGKGEKVFTWMGPVQFKFGRSLHRVEPLLVKGTSVLPTQEQKAAGAFTEAWVLPYSLICFYGIINENAAKTTGLSEEDIKYLLDGMWNGTKNLITRSKVGQMPRFLMRIIYNDGNYHIGDLDKRIKLIDRDGKEVDKEGRSGKTLRSISDVKIDITKLVNILKQNSERIKGIQIEVNEEVMIVVNNEEYKGKAVIEAFNPLPELKDKIKTLELEQ